MMIAINKTTTSLITRHGMEDVISRCLSVSGQNQRLVTDLIDGLTPADVSRQEVAFNVELVANEGLTLAGLAPTQSLLSATEGDSSSNDHHSPFARSQRSFFPGAFRQLVALACYFAAIYAVGLFILTIEVGMAAAVPLAAKTCAGKSLIAAIVGPWIQRITGAKSSCH